MKKNTLKAFTLVEMLIVIVIIGILIAALLPRMQAAQGRARDVARKTALSQIQSAIVTHQGDHGAWPSQTAAKAGISIDTIKDDLINAGMSDVPRDPLSEATVSGLGNNTFGSGQFAYMVSVRNGSENAGFALMAKTEVAGGSNRVVCSAGSGKIASGTDLAKIHPCPAVNKGSSDSDCSNPNDGTTACKYGKESELRYIVLY